MPEACSHCDFGIVALRLTTDTQHRGYVLRDGESGPPAGLVAAFRTGNRLEDMVMEEVKPGRTGNEVLRASLAHLRPGQSQMPEAYVKYA